MGLHDRPYWKDEQDGGAGGLGGVRIGMPKPGKMVKYLLIINLAVFLLQIISGLALKIELSLLFGATVADWWQVWRYVTFQFLHSRYSLFHIGLNMLGLYMLGTPLEQRWGGRRFLRFYLSCGAVAGLAYVIVGALLEGAAWKPLIGASGGVYGILLAAAVLFPNFRVILVLFPVPIRLAAVIIFGGMILVLLGSVEQGVYSGEFWSHVAHMGGAGMAAVWLWVIPKVRGAGAEWSRRSNEGAWQRKLQRQREEEAEIDRILQKIHDRGIGSLTRKEKRILQDTTRRQQKEQNELSRRL